MKYRMNFYQNFYSAYSYVGEYVEFASVDDIATFFIQGMDEYPDKHAVPMFNFCVFNESESRERASSLLIPNYENSIRRCKSNCIGITALILDYDANATIDEALEIIGNLKCIIYTTYRHSVKKHKFRIILPLTRLLTTDELDLKRDGLLDRFPGIDHSSFTISQAFYFPSHGIDNKDIATVFEHGTTLFDPDDIANTVIPEVIPKSKNEYTGTSNYLSKLISCLLTGSNLHYGGTNGVLPLITLIKSAGGNIDDVLKVINAIKAPDSCLGDKNIINTIKHKTFNQCGDKFSAIKRDKLLKELNCQPYGSTPSNSDSDRITKDKKAIAFFNRML